MPTTDKKISGLPEATTANPSDYLVMVQAGTTKKISKSNYDAANLIATNNLSDLENIGDARTNLDVPSNSEVTEMFSNLFGEGYAQPGTPGIPSGTTYQNSFVAGAIPLKIYAGGYNNKFVFFRGTVDCSAVTLPGGTSVLIVTLPTLYRPAVDHNFLVLGLYAAIGVLTVKSNGQVLLRSHTGDLQTSGIVDLSSVSYTTLP